MPENPIAAADASINEAPLPLPKTLRARKNLFFQFGRFILLNVRMIKVIAGGVAPLDH